MSMMERNDGIGRWDGLIGLDERTEYPAAPAGTTLGRVIKALGKRFIFSIRPLFKHIK